MISSSPPAPRLPADPVSFEGAASLGNRSAPLGLMEFADFECPYCGKFALEVLPVLQKRYIDDGRLRLVYRHLVIPGHKHAGPAALVASCAAEQGKFKPIHDLLFANPKALDDDSLGQYVKEVGLDRASYRACVATTGPSRVNADTVLAKSLGLTATPSFLIGQINGERLIAKKALKGVKSVQEFTSAIDEVLAGK
jgi:protein-disulfide isomerase